MGLFNLLNPIKPQPMESPESQTEKNAEAPEMKFVRDQLKKAIEIEDYEQAAVLRDVLGAGEKQGIAFELRKKDFMTPSKGGVYVYSQDDPKHRAWEGIDELRQQNYFDGQRIINESEFSYNLVSPGFFISPLDDEEWDEIRRLKNAGGTKKIDYLLNLRDKIKDVKDIIELAKEKFENIWQPFCQKRGLSGPKYEEFNSTYNDNCHWTTERATKALNNIPADIDAPLHYWQTVYDNSRFTLRELNKASKELE